MRRFRGFSLIELLVVLVLAVGAVTLVLPSMQRATLRAEASALSRDIRAMCAFAQAKARTELTDSRVAIDLETGQLYVPGAERRLAIPSHVDIRTTTARSEALAEQIFSIRFFPDGSSTGGRISIRSKHGREIVIDVDWLTGAAKIHGAT